MNGFTDMHVAFDSSGPPTRARLSNRWVRDTADLGPIWLGAATSAASQAVSTGAAPGWRLWASGSVFSYRGDAAQPLDRFAADLAIGRADPALLDAHAVVFGFDEQARQLSVWTDRMGTVHAYACGRLGRRSVGTFLPAVAEGAGGGLDWLGITGFCGFGFYPGDRTMHEDVRVLRPATHTVFDEHGLVVSERRYWDWWHDPDPTRTDDDLIDEFHDIWTRTVQMQVAGTRAVVPLSGGLDSRTVFAAAAPTGGVPPDHVRTLTYGYAANASEIRIARRVAVARGHQVAELVVEPYLLDRLPEVLDAVEGFQSLSFSRQAGASTSIAALGDHVVGGHWGDVWFDAAGGPGLDGTSDLVAIAHEKFAKRGRAWLLDRICAAHLDEPPEEALRHLLTDELARLPALDDPDMRLKALKTEQWSFRWTLASVRAYQLAVPTLLPFYANEVVDFFLRVPSDRLPGRRLQVAYLRRHHPDLARVTWERTGMSLLGRPWEPSVAGGRRVVAKAARTMRHQDVTTRNWERQYLGGDRPERLRRLLADLSPEVGGVAAPDDVRTLLDGFLAAPDAGSGYAVDALLTLAAAVGGSSVPMGE